MQRVSGNRYLEPSENPKLQALLALWNKVRGARELPARRDMGIEPFRPWFGHIGILRVLEKEPPRLFVALAGTQINLYDGEEFTGRFLEEMVPRHARAAILEPYDRCLLTRQPVFTRLEPGALRGSFRHVDRLILPCSDDGRRIDRMVVGFYVSELDTRVGNIFDRT